MTYTETITISTQGFCDIINITPQVKEFVEEVFTREETDERPGLSRERPGRSSVSGLANIFVKGSTASITTIEFEPNLVKDFQEFLEKLIPQDMPTRHGNTWGDDNGFSHLRASLLGPSVSVPIINHQLQLGTWQQVVLCDFDNRPRQREVTIQIAI